jgi:hypothetical protein
MIIPDLNTWPVNWRDGMKVRAGHFQEEAAASGAALRDLAARQLSAYSYGLIPGESRARFQIPEIELIESRKVRVHLRDCRAVTPGGTRIEISPDQPLVDTLSWQERDEEQIRQQDKMSMLIMIQAAPDSFREGGEPDPDELPPRYPHRMPSYRLFLQPFESDKTISQTKYTLPLGAFSLVGGRLIQDELYIPPSCVVEAHPLLSESFRKQKNMLNRLLQSLEEVLRIAGNTKLRVNERVRQNDLSPAIFQMAQSLYGQIISFYDTLIWTGSDAPPLALMLPAMRTARHVRLTQLSLPKGESVNLLNYLDQFGDLSPDQFNTTIQSLLSQAYHHNHAAPLLQAAHSFWDMLDKSFGALAQRDDYIWDGVKQEGRSQIHRTENQGHSESGGRTIRINKPNPYGSD